MSFFSTQVTKSPSGFTLTELIIVVAILVTLGTIAFASYSDYTVSSRDAKRSSDLVTIRGNLSTYLVKNGEYPKPTNFVEVRATVATGSTVLLRQGVIDTTLATSLDIAGGGRDPSTNQGYTLSVDAQGKRAQVLAYFEKTGADVQLSARFPNLFENAYAEDVPLADKFPVSAGEKLWTFVQGTSLIPLEQTQTGSIALPTLSGSGFMVVGGCLTTERITSVATGYPEGLYEGPCEYIPYISSMLNNIGQDGDEIVAYDNRAYNHPAVVIAANGGNPDFFDKRYKLIKINGKWWTNQNLAYPAGSFADDNWTTSDYTCTGKSASTSACDEIAAKGYLYSSPHSNPCMPGWSKPSNAEVAALNNLSAGTESGFYPTMNITPVGSKAWNESYFNYGGAIKYSWFDSYFYFQAPANGNAPCYYVDMTAVKKVFNYSWYGCGYSSFAIRCVKD